MKKLLLWLLMVVLFVVLLVGGTGAALYSLTTETKLPPSTTTLGDAALEPIGYDWKIPILGEYLVKPFYQAPTLSVQKLGEVGYTIPTLTLPDWATKTELTLTAPDGSTALTGTAADFAGYTYTQNGSYQLSLTVWQQASADPNSAGHSPEGWYRYAASYTLALAPELTLSTVRASQGDVVALLITGILGDDKQSAPAADTDLGTVTFHQVEGGWMGYIPVTYNAESGTHTIALTVAGQSLSAELTVVKKIVQSAQTTAEETPAGAESEFKNAIWPLYNAGKEEKLWTGPFAAPSANGVKISYGASLTADGQSAGRATGLTYYSTPAAEVTAPQAGVVVYAGSLALTGGTVVIDHGCGVKSFLYGLDTVTAQSGQNLAKGDAIGTVGDAHTLIYELRIGSKSVDPAAAIQGDSGLQYKENLG